MFNCSMQADIPSVSLLSGSERLDSAETHSVRATFSSVEDRSGSEDLWRHLSSPLQFVLIAPLLVHISLLYFLDQHKVQIYDSDFSWNFLLKISRRSDYPGSYWI